MRLCIKLVTAPLMGMILCFLMYTNVYCFEINHIGYADGENEITLNYSISADALPIDAVVVNAAYSKDNELLASELSNASVDAGENVRFRSSLSVSAGEENPIIKTFVLQSLASLSPVGGCCSSYVSELPLLNENISWDFYDEDFLSLGVIAETTQVNGLTLITSEGGKELSVKPDGYLSFFGGGRLTDCAASFEVKAPCRIGFFLKSLSSDEERYLQIVDAEGNVLDSVLASKDGFKMQTFNYNGAGERLYIFSRSSGIAVSSIETFYNYEDVGANELYVTDFPELKKAIIRLETLSKGTIYINTNYMLCSVGLNFDKTAANITIKNGEGFTPILDFSAYREQYEDTVKASSKHGLSIRGSGYCMDGFIVQNAPGNGISLSNGASDNIIKNIVVRYNAGSGVGIGSNASNNTITSCDSYRNCDVIRFGGDADGFSCKLGAGTGNKFYNCRSWENSDDGWDLFAMYEDVTIEECMTWHNGDPDVFTGKYDFDNGMPLDENMHLIQIFMKNNPDFKTNYENGIFKYPQGSFITATKDRIELLTVSVDEFIGASWEGNPNGFKLGSGDSKHGPQVTEETTRYLKNCIAFDHEQKGFDRNNSTCTVYIENAVAFDNQKFNYMLDNTNLCQLDNAITFNGNDRIPSSFSLILPSDSDARVLRAKVFAEKERIEGLVRSNSIPGYTDFLITVFAD